MDFLYDKPGIAVGHDSADNTCSNNRKQMGKSIGIMQGW